MRIPVLTYHASTVAGHDYHNNDHVALAADLRLINDLGFRVVPMADVIDQLLGRASHDLSHALVLTCDDGCDLEVRDVEYPGFGWQPSFLSILKQAHAEFGWQPCMTSFVIADADARQKMDEHCLHGLGWMADDWWHGVALEKYISIESHGWDHNHEVLGAKGFDGMASGTFLNVDTDKRADFQIAQSIEFINQKIAPARCRLFAYPYGHVPDYLRRSYLPENAERLGLEAAFGTERGYVDATADQWSLPRFVCGWHWKSTQQLERILLDSQL